MKNENSPAELKGIAGWLMLAGFLLSLGAAWSLYKLILFVPLLPLLLEEFDSRIIYEIVFSIFQITLFIWFLLEKKYVPTLIIAAVWVNFFAYFFFSEIDTTRSWTVFSFSVIGTAYFMNSKRVNNTFIK